MLLTAWREERGEIGLRGQMSATETLLDDGRTKEVQHKQNRGILETRCCQMRYLKRSTVVVLGVLQEESDLTR